MSITNINSTVNPKKLIVTQDGKTYKKAGLESVVAGVIVGSKAYDIVYNSGNEFAKQFLKHSLNGQTSLNESVRPFISDLIKKSGLEKTGLKIVEATPINISTNIDLLIGKIEAKLPSFIKQNNVFKNILKNKFIPLMESIEKGQNAAYVPLLNKIIVKTDKMSWPIPHELGHAINSNRSKFGKLAHSLKVPGILFSSSLLLFALFKRKKVEGEQPKGWLDKTTSFLKDNCGKLAFLGYVPCLIEEALASFNGIKLAKDFLTPDKLKNMKKLYFLAWCSYLKTPLLMSLAVYVASKVKDFIAAPKEIKQ